MTDSSLLPVMIIGARGRMGQALITAAPEARARVAGQADQGDVLSEQIRDSQALIDFSHPSATQEVLNLALARKVPVVIGTTGHTAEQLEAIRQASQSIPVCKAGNYSIGVNLLFHLTEIAARSLGEDFQPEVSEIHHRQKKDAPSGTAMDLADRIRAARAWEPETLRHGREGEVGARPNRELGMHALRGGQVIGEHTVFFFGEKERIELTHRAADRGIFAMGALRAARWLTRQQPGLYNMQDVLGLKPL